MAEDMLIAVGGTGQEVAHFYLIATLLGIANDTGAITNVALIDQDDIGPSLLTLQEICNLLNDLGVQRIPRVVTATPFSFDKDDSLASQLTTPSTGKLVRPALRAFYATEREGTKIVEQNLSKGLFFKPFIAATIDAAQPARIDAALKFPGTRAALVGSLAGGTMAGLAPAIIERLGTESKEVMGIFFERWFQMIEHDAAEDRVATASTYNSNTAGVLSVLNAQQPKMPKWLLLTGNVERRRQGEFGKNAEDFAAGDDPRLEACILIDDLIRHDFKGEKTTFESRRELQQVSATTATKWRQAWEEAASTAHAVLASIQETEWVRALHDDPLAHVVWGTRIAGYVGTAWRSIASRTGAQQTRTAKAFGDQLAKEAEDVAEQLRQLLPPVERKTIMTRHRLKIRGQHLSDATQPRTGAVSDYATLCKAYGARLTCALMQATDAEVRR